METTFVNRPSAFLEQRPKVELFSKNGNAYEGKKKRRQAALSQNPFVKFPVIYLTQHTYAGFHSKFFLSLPLCGENISRYIGISLEIGAGT